MFCRPGLLHQSPPFPCDKNLCTGRINELLHSIVQGFAHCLHMLICLNPSWKKKHLHLFLFYLNQSNFGPLHGCFFFFSFFVISYNVKNNWIYTPGPGYVQKPINANPRLKINQEFISLLPNSFQCWYSAKLYSKRSQSWKNEISKINFQQKVENMSKQTFSLILSYRQSAFEQPGPGLWFQRYHHFELIWWRHLTCTYLNRRSQFHTTGMDTWCTWQY